MIHLVKIAHAGVITDATPISRIVLNFLNLLLQIFGILAIISLLVAGIRYYLSAGDAELAKKAKKSAIYSVIGIAIAAGAMIIIKTITGIVR